MEEKIPCMSNITWLTAVTLAQLTFYTPSGRYPCAEYRPQITGIPLSSPPFGQQTTLPHTPTHSATGTPGYAQWSTPDSALAWRQVC